MGEPKEKQVLDPADYLFQTTKYHNRQITVGNPDTDQVETIGVSTSHLVSHSPVFRGMLEESELADPTGENTHITDVTPDVFKLMLRYVYGGKLPKMSPETTAQLALCADKYDIQPLVTNALALLKPTTLQNVFSALRCVVYLNAPDVEIPVLTIIQEETDKLIAHEEFLTLDGNCQEFIAKQEHLAVSELELWKGLVKWAKQQTNDPTEMRKLLEKPLRHVRILTLTEDEVIKEVMTSKVLTSAEMVDLLSAINNQLTLKSSLFSSTKQCRSQTTSTTKKKTRSTFKSEGLENLRNHRECQLVFHAQPNHKLLLQSLANL